MTTIPSDLPNMMCEACRSGAPQVEEAEIAELMPRIHEWEIVEIKDMLRLRRTYEFDDWLSAVEFTNKIAEAAEENDHHPLIRLEWGKVQVNWWTHKIKGLHMNDFIMAAKSDRIFSK